MTSIPARPQQHQILNQCSTQQSQSHLLAAHGTSQFNEHHFHGPSIHTQQSSILIANNQAPPTFAHKVLPLKQLKDVITDMEQQKIRYDQKCRDSGLPIETMEQFMYTYLNQKYGLKNLIIEWASTIIHSIKAYLRDDH